MSANSQNSGNSSIISKLLGRNRKGNRTRRPLASRGSRHLQMEGLEKREMFAVSSLYLSGGALAVYADNAPTSVTVSTSGSNIRISEVGTTRFWDYASSQVGRVDFVGGAGNDRFVNNVSNLATRAWGMAGDDYLEGYNNVDIFVGGENNDTLVGYGGNDQMWGGGGHDIIRGMGGDDYLVGEAGNDYIDGGSENDKIWGSEGADVLLGGYGDDELSGDAGTDRLNGQAGFDKLWGGTEDDVLVSLDTVYSEYVDGGAGADTMWIDNQYYTLYNFISDNVVGVTSADVVQRVNSFSNGADKTLDGDNIADPTDIGAKLRYTNTVTTGKTLGSNPLFSYGMPTVFGPGGLSIGIPGGPKSTDITQSNTIGDCWMLAGLGSLANTKPNAIRQNVVDFDDGTYGVALGNSFYRVDNELPVWSTSGGATSGNLRHAKLGAENSMWVAIVEKAFASYRGSNTYASLNGGGASDLFNAFHLSNVTTKYLDDYKGAATTMANELYNKWKQGYTIAIGSMAVVGGGNHEFSVERFNVDANGTVTGIVVRNPWGTDSLGSFVTLSGGDGGSNANDGFFTLTPTQLVNARGWVYWGRA